MKERPILFSGPMVRALLEDRKTQTRRVVKYKNIRQTPPMGKLFSGGFEGDSICPYGQAGDRLWVRETWGKWVKETWDLGGNVRESRSSFVKYRADDTTGPITKGPWKPSIHMPRSASRILLEIVSVRVERVQEISDYDSKMEGVDPMPLVVPGYPFLHRDAFKILWDSINGARGFGWDKNPWVWAIEFKRIQP